MIYKTRHFSRWARKALLPDDLLRHAVEEMVNGLIDADLGGGVFKKRIALPGRGKSGSARTLLATNRDDRWVFILGFEKNERVNIPIKNVMPCVCWQRTCLAYLPSNCTKPLAKAHYRR